MMMMGMMRLVEEDEDKNGGYSVRCHGAADEYGHGARDKLVVVKAVPMMTVRFL